MDSLQEASSIPRSCSFNSLIRKPSLVLSSFPRVLKSMSEASTPEPPARAAALGARIIFELPLLSVQGRTYTIDISPTAIAGCIRLVDCVALTKDKVLRIWEFPESPIEEWVFGDSLPKCKYSAISYVWKGNPVVADTMASSNHAGYLMAKGAEDGDPISIDVLRSACLASLRHDEGGRWRMISRAEYVWLDRLCIVQTSKVDKSLQIAQMYKIYKCCMQCLILSGGIQRLVSLEEETSWAHRAWTLQECLAPHMSVVLFSWTRGTGRVLGTSVFRLREVGGDTECAYARFVDVLRACIDGPMVFNACPMDSPLSKWRSPEIIAAGTTIDVRIFGKGQANLLALRQARLQFQNSSEPADPSVTRRCYSTVWRCALMRTSSRPVDMVFSIMGLMDVALNPKHFAENDRLGATVALISVILSRGGSADWLGMPASIPPCPHLSTFPQFAETDVAGDARYLISNQWTTARSLDDWYFSSTTWGSTGKGEIWPWERLYGRIDEVGYLSFRRKACVVVPGAIKIGAEHEHFPEHVFQWPLLQATDNTVWQFQENFDMDLQSFPKIAAIPLWRFWDYTEFDVAGLASSVSALKFMLVKEHAAGKFHLVSYFYVQDEDRTTWKSRVDQWKEYEFAVGGPESLPGSEGQGSVKVYTCL